MLLDKSPEPTAVGAFHSTVPSDEIEKPLLATRNLIFKNHLKLADFEVPMSGWI